VKPPPSTDTEQRAPSPSRNAAGAAAAHVGGDSASGKPNVYATSAAAVSSGESSSSTLGFQRTASSRMAEVKPASEMSVVVRRYAVEKSQCACAESHRPNQQDSTNAHCVTTKRLSPTHCTSSSSSSSSSAGCRSSAGMYELQGAARLDSARCVSVCTGDPAPAKQRPLPLSHEPPEHGHVTTPYVVRV
jgi:hypothetical protein